MWGHKEQLDHRVRSVLREPQDQQEIRVLLERKGLLEIKARMEHQDFMV
jgi:hypothetical protein